MELFCYKCKCDNISELIDIASKERFLLVVNDTKEIRDKLINAYLEAFILERDNSLHAKNIALEVICLLANTFNIKEAIEKVVPKNGNDFLVVSDDIESIEKILHLCKEKKEIKLEFNIEYGSDISNLEIEKGL